MVWNFCNIKQQWWYAVCEDKYYGLRIPKKKETVTRTADNRIFRAQVGTRAGLKVRAAKARYHPILEESTERANIRNCQIKDSCNMYSVAYIWIIMYNKCVTLKPVAGQVRKTSLGRTSYMKISIWKCLSLVAKYFIAASLVPVMLM